MRKKTIIEALADASEDCAPAALIAGQVDKLIEQVAASNRPGSLTFTVSAKRSGDFVILSERVSLTVPTLAKDSEPCQQFSATVRTHLTDTSRYAGEPNQ